VAIILEASAVIGVYVYAGRPQVSNSGV